MFWFRSGVCNVWCFRFQMIYHNSLCYVLFLYSLNIITIVRSYNVPTFLETVCGGFQFLCHILVLKQPSQLNTASSFYLLK